ncbi:MAG: DUF4129 domain-containing protein [Actinomyces sp.]|uniref:DUF4129 domain-containing protein n=1 Tax=Actinomyces sp. TaxID=29317 RepID=UPI0026DCAE7C|nr:DUF4129 domain-containing protein [Actinomyces sp.]MDO4242268.1 DUF4129 domain-containing protein [Actinomyces sp.]
MLSVATQTTYAGPHLTHAPAVLPALGAPATPDAEEARRRAEAELAKPVYHEQESLWSMLWRWIVDNLDPRDVVPQVPDWLSVLIVLVLAALLVLMLLRLPTRVSSLRRGRLGDQRLFDDDRDSAALMSAADAAASSGDWDIAVIERFRAIIRSLDERCAIDSYPGMTSHEAAEQASVAIDSMSADLAQAAALFDAVRYGELVSAPTQDAWMRELADRLAQAPLVGVAEAVR